LIKDKFIDMDMVTSYQLENIVMGGKGYGGWTHEEMRKEYCIRCGVAYIDYVLNKYKEYERSVKESTKKNKRG